MRNHQVSWVTFSSCLVLASALVACDGGYDSNNDRVADDLGSTLDNDHDGDPDQWDRNRDGTFDGIGVDINGDLVPDAIAVDSDSDGFYESISDKDQAITRSQLVPLPAPVYAVGQNPTQN